MVTMVRGKKTEVVRSQKSSGRRRSSLKKSRPKPFPVIDGSLDSLLPYLRHHQQNHPSVDTDPMHSLYASLLPCNHGFIPYYAVSSSGELQFENYCFVWFDGNGCHFKPLEDPLKASPRPTSGEKISTSSSQLEYILRLVEQEGPGKVNQGSCFNIRIENSSDATKVNDNDTHLNTESPEINVVDVEDDDTLQAHHLIKLCRGKNSERQLRCLDKDGTVSEIRASAFITDEQALERVRILGIEEAQREISAFAALIVMGDQYSSDARKTGSLQNQSAKNHKVNYLVN